MRATTLLILGFGMLWGTGCAALAVGGGDPCLAEVGVSCEEFERRLERYSRRELYWAMPEAEFRTLYTQPISSDSDRPRLLRQTDHGYELGWGGRSAAFRVTFEQGVLTRYEERWIDKIVWVYNAMTLPVAKEVRLSLVQDEHIEVLLSIIDETMDSLRHKAAWNNSLSWATIPWDNSRRKSFHRHEANTSQDRHSYALIRIHIIPSRTTHDIEIHIVPPSYADCSPWGGIELQGTITRKRLQAIVPYSREVHDTIAREATRQFQEHIQPIVAALVHRLGPDNLRRLEGK